jgi:hypothetical protein
MLLDELGTYLQAQGIGTLGTTLFLGGLPQDSPNIAVQDACVALIEIPGLPPSHVHTQQQASYEQPVVQIICRGAPYGYPAARTRAQQAWKALDGLSNVVLQGETYLWVLAMQSPFLLRVDEMARPILVFNIRCAKGL